MPRRRKQGWKPAATTKVVRLPPNGPKAGQTTEQWLRNKTAMDQKFMDNPKNKFNDLP